MLSETVNFGKMSLTFCHESILLSLTSLHFIRKGHRDDADV